MALKLIPGAPPITITAAPASKANFSVVVPAGQAATLTLEQEQQTSFVSWTDPHGKTHPPRTNRDGLHSKIRFTLLGGGGGENRFSLSSSSGKRPARVRAYVGALRASAPSDAAAIATEDALAGGDLLWAKHDPKNAAQVLAAYDRAIAGSRQLGDRPILRRSLEWKAIYLAFTSGNAQAALPLLLEATQIRDGDDLVQQASAWKTLGFVQTTLADYPNGWRDYAKALALFQRTGDRFNQEVLLENRGKLSRLTGDYDGALHDAAAAAAIARSLDDRVGVLHIEDDIGEIYLLRGQMQAAFDAYQEVLGLQSLNAADPIIGFAETDLANLYHQLNAGPQSEDMIARADTFWKAHPYFLGQMETQIDEGKLEAGSGNLAQADRIYRSGLKLAQGAKMQREQVFFLLGLGNVAMEGRRNAQAASYLGRASKLAVALGESDALSEIHTTQGDLALRAGRPQDAAQFYRQALAVANRSFDHAETVAALGGLAHAESTLGDARDARQHIEEALNGIESTRDFLPVSSLRTEYFSSRHSYYSLAVKILTSLNALHPGSGYDREALNIAERARARFLLDQMEQSGADLKPNSDPSLTAARSDTLRELHLAEGSLAVLQFSGKKSENAPQLKTQVAELLEREDGIESAIYRRDRQRPHAGLGGIPSPAPLIPAQDRIAQLQPQLGPTTALLEYWTGKNASYLWVVTKNSVRLHTLAGAQQLAPLAWRLSEESVRPFASAPASAEQFAVSLASSRAEFAATSLRLGRMLLPAGAIPRGARTLLIVGDGPVLSVPFEALRIPLARGEGSVYVQDKYCVVREPSIGVLLDLLDRPLAPRRMKIALFADPIFSTRDARLRGQAAGEMSRAEAAAPQNAATKLTATEAAEHAASPFIASKENRTAWASVAGMTGLAPLPFAGAEARQIAKLAGPDRSRLLTGSAASLENVRSTPWADYTVAHFATHALLNPSHPELASIMLSTVDRSGLPQPGVLWFSDICSLSMPVDLVVLSACQTANGNALPGEGLVGISYAFFVAGARRVIGSLWNVDDEATGILMRDFYAALLDGAQSPAEALRVAQGTMRRTPRWSDPYYWAGFTIAGNWRSIPQ